MPERMRAVFEAGFREMARDRLRSAMALRVLRDVFGCVPESLVILLAVDPADDWDDADDDEGDLSPHLDCATLEALARPARGFRPGPSG